MTEEKFSKFVSKMTLANHIVLIALKEFTDSPKTKQSEKKQMYQITVSAEEHEILLQSLGARKKLHRGKIRNNQTHMAADDKPDWSEKDYLKAINMRKRQLADADMLMTRIENI